MSGLREKKQLPLRLSAKLYEALASWAEDEFRSVNGQIEYLLTECVKRRGKGGARERERGEWEQTETNGSDANQKA